MYHTFSTENSLKLLLKGRLCALGRVSNMAPAAEFLDSQGEVVKFTLLRHAALIKIQDISQLITIILVLRACVVAAEEFFD